MTKMKIMGFYLLVAPRDGLRSLRCVEIRMVNLALLCARERMSTVFKLITPSATQALLARVTRPLMILLGIKRKLCGADAA